MTDKREIVSSIGRVVARVVQPIVVHLTARLDGLDARLNALPQAPAGPPGPVGPRGDAGIGHPGTDGKDGRDGRDGLSGKDGRDGRDAFEIEILPTIAPDKSYARGTLAAQNGGLWRAFRQTELAGELAHATAIETCGWEIIVDGLHRFEIRQATDNERTLVVECLQASGKMHQLRLQLPVMIYRDIWTEDRSYDRGDVVTYSHSSWHSMTDGNQARPGMTDDWRLMVRQGRNGKDGVNGKDGLPGPPGKPGRDLTQMGFDGEKH